MNNINRHTFGWWNNSEVRLLNIELLYEKQRDSGDPLVTVALSNSVALQKVTRYKRSRVSCPPHQQRHQLWRATAVDAWFTQTTSPCKREAWYHMTWSRRRWPIDIAWLSPVKTTRVIVRFVSRHAGLAVDLCVPRSDVGKNRLFSTIKYQTGNVLWT